MAKKVKEATARAAKKEKKEAARNKKAEHKARIAEKEAEIQKKQQEKADAKDKANQEKQSKQACAILLSISDMLARVVATKARDGFPHLGKDLQEHIENGWAFAMKLKQEMQRIQLQPQLYQFQDGMDTPKQVMNTGNMLKLKNDLAKVDAILKILEKEA